MPHGIRGFTLATRSASSHIPQPPDNLIQLAKVASIKGAKSVTCPDNRLACPGNYAVNIVTKFNNTIEDFQKVVPQWRAIVATAASVRIDRVRGGAARRGRGASAGGRARRGGGGGRGRGAALARALRTRTHTRHALDASTRLLIRVCIPTAGGGHGRGGSLQEGGRGRPREARARQGRRRRRRRGRRQRRRAGRAGRAVGAQGVA
jgi:hypothetical protein